MMGAVFRLESQEGCERKLPPHSERMNGESRWKVNNDQNGYSTLLYLLSLRSTWKHNMMFSVYMVLFVCINHMYNKYHDQQANGVAE